MTLSPCTLAGSQYGSLWQMRRRTRREPSRLCSLRSPYRTRWRRPFLCKWIETVQSIIITGSRQQAGRQEGLSVWGLRMHVGSALRPRSEARSVPPPPSRAYKRKICWREPGMSDDVCFHLQTFYGSLAPAAVVADMTHNLANKTTETPSFSNC